MNEVGLIDALLDRVPGAGWLISVIIALWIIGRLEDVMPKQKDTSLDDEIVTRLIEVLASGNHTENELAAQVRRLEELVQQQESQINKLKELHHDD